jgi:pimeloyl-ACP methyl ester carboxylesterase
MARWMAGAIRCPTDSRTIGSQMGYPYAMRWLGTAGGLDRLRAFNPQCPMLFMYGERKPFMFHSRAWTERLAARPRSRVMGFATGHWIMIERRSEFNEALLAWLRESEKQI